MRQIIVAASLMLTLPVMILMGYNFYVDPYQYYRKWSGPYPIFSTKGRYQNPGLIRHYDFDTIIVGTSRSQNFTPEMFANTDWKPIKLVASDSGSHVHAQTMKLAFETGKVERVILELSSTSYRHGATHLRHGRSFPEFLYEPTIETPFLYLFSYDIFKRSMRVLRGEKWSSTLAELGVWQHRYEQDFGKNRYLENVELDCRPMDTVPVGWRGDYPLIDQALEKNIESFLISYPAIEILGFLPPFPISKLGVINEAERRLEFGFRHRVYELAGKYENFRLFDFALVGSIVGDPNRYKDFGHYDQSANQTMAEAMTNGAWQTTKDDPTEANRQMRNIADAFDWGRWTECAKPAIQSSSLTNSR